MDDELRTKWDRLVGWLQDHKGFECHVEWKELPGAGRGLFTTSSIEPGSTLLTIPASALLNPLTLPPSIIPPHLFPLRTSHAHSAKRARTSITTRRLNTTQLLTLYLTLIRHAGRRRASPWEAYLDSLPGDFRPWHPVTWLIPPSDAGRLKQWRRWSALAGMVPRSARVKLEGVRARFEEDLEVVQRVLRDEELFKSQHLATRLTAEDILWAWLNVNTRTVSVPLNLPSPTELHNHTLVPILDFANHSASPEDIIPRPRQVPTANVIGKRAHLIPGKIGFSLIAPEKGMKAGEEVMFEYGGHSNGVLFAEYGFVEMPREVGWLGRRNAQVDVAWAVGELWDGIEGREEKEEALRTIGCWGSNILHSEPSPPHPQFSLLMTLRLLHLPRSSPKLDSVRRGEFTYISPKNEAAVLSSLKTVCERVIEQAESGMVRLSAVDALGDESQSGVEMVRALWEEELEIARAVLLRVEEGEDLS